MSPATIESHSRDTGIPGPEVRIHMEGKLDGRHHRLKSVWEKYGTEKIFNITVRLFIRKHNEVFTYQIAVHSLFLKPSETGKVSSKI